MSSAAKPHIIHESETQRQHVRLPLPVKIEMNGRIYNVVNMSPGGISVRNVEGNFTQGHRIPIAVKIPFEKFSLDVNVEAEAKYFNTRDKMLGCRFLNLTSAQVSLFNHVMKSFLAGDVVVANDLLNVVSRDNFVKVRKLPDAPLSKNTAKKQITGLLAFAALGIAVVAFIGANIYQNLFTMSANDAVVRGPVIEVRAPLPGLYKSKLAPDAVIAGPSQIIGEIVPPETMAAGPYATTRIKSPCDCYIVEKFRNDNDFVEAGAKLVSLIPMDARPWIIAETDPLKAAKIRPNDKARFMISDSKIKFTGRVTNIKSGMDEPSAANPYLPRPVRIQITPDQNIPPDLTGRPVRVVFSIR